MCIKCDALLYRNVFSVSLSLSCPPVQIVHNYVNPEVRNRNQKCLMITIEGKEIELVFEWGILFGNRCSEWAGQMKGNALWTYFA